MYFYLFTFNVSIIITIDDVFHLFPIFYDINVNETPRNSNIQMENHLYEILKDYLKRVYSSTNKAKWIDSHQKTRDFEENEIKKVI